MKPQTVLLFTHCNIQFPLAHAYWEDGVARTGYPPWSPVEAFWVARWPSGEPQTRDRNRRSVELLGALGLVWLEAAQADRTQKYSANRPRAARASTNKPPAHINSPTSW